MSDQEPEIQQPDPAARRRAVLIVGWAALAGSLCVYALTRSEAQLQALLEAWLPTLARHPWLPAAANLLLASPVVVLSIQLFRMGTRTVTTRRYPPPDVAVTKPTRILRGRSAVRRGRLVQAVCIALMAAVGGLTLAIWRLFDLLAGMS